MNALLRVLGLWRRRAGWLLAGAVVSLAAVAAGVGLMVIAGHVIAAAFLFGVLTAPVALDAFGAGRVVLRYLDRLLTHEATFRALADLRVWFFRGLARNGAGGLGFRQAGDVLARLVGDVEALDGLYLRILVPLLGAVMLLPGLIVVLGGGAAAWAAGILFAIAAFGLPAVTYRAAVERGRALADASGALRVATVDALSGMREVRAFGAEGRMLAAIQARESALLGAQHALGRRAAVAGVLALLCAQAAILAVLAGFGARPIAAVVGVFLAVAAFEAVAALPRAGILAGHAAAAAGRVIQVAEEQGRVAEAVEPVALPRATGLRFEGVHFRWRADGPAVFDGLSLEIPAGSRVALLGPSGSGKSSLAALALRLADPDAGRVLLGGVDLRSLRLEELRSRVVLLSQATHLFDDTIRRNLLLTRPDASDAALWEALEAAQLRAFVEGLPDGLDTWVGEGGARLSGGQGRRLALARTLLSPAPVLILDEPAAGLDAETERAFLTTLNGVEGRTVVLIAHRLMGVERLDRIWRLSEGRAIAAAG